MQERRERLGVCVEALANAIGLSTEVIEYIEHYGQDWTWCIEPAMAHLDEIEAERTAETVEAPRYCIAMGAPFLAHCVECLAGDGSP